MESYNYIESGIVFSLKDRRSLEKFKYQSKDFSVHQKTIDFVLNYSENYENFPTEALLLEKFPDLDKNAVGLDIEYCLQEFDKQLIFRKTVEVINSNKDLLKSEPKNAIKKILSGLEDVELSFDDDIEIYDNGALSRLEDYNKKVELRNKGLKTLGIPTSFKTINRTTIGWMKGDLVSIFARPGIGKTFLLIHAAAVAYKFGFKVLFISTEMSKAAINARMDVMLGKMYGYDFSHTSIRRGEGLDKEKYKEFLTKLNSKRLIVLDSIERNAITYNGIASKVRKYKPDLLVLDGIQLIASEKSSNAVWEKMFNLFYGIKTLSLSSQITSIVSTQANRKAADLFVPPKVAEVAFGDALIQASDYAMSLCRVRNEPLQLLVQFQKFRDEAFPADYVTMHWDVDKGDIKEI
ncbi:AAA family ATPase [Candidatus Daviesbacteria bacterium]|nr:AAA family ATPase [Candidatus Daviesbacteria bacterium]